MLGVHVVFITRLSQFAVHRPHLPGHTFRLEGPTRATFLEELEADGAARCGSAVGAAEQVGEV